MKALVFGGVATGLGLLGPVGFVRTYVRKFADLDALIASMALPDLVGARQGSTSTLSGTGTGGFARVLARASTS